MISCQKFKRMALHGVTCSEVTVVYTRAEGDDTIRESSEPTHVRFDDLSDHLNSFLWSTEMDVTEIVSVSLKNVCTGSPHSDPDADGSEFDAESQPETETESDSDSATECLSDFDEDTAQFESESSSDSDSDANVSGTDCD